MLKGWLVAGGIGTLLVAAFSSSSSYKLQNYGIGSGGTNTSSSSSYKLNGSVGESAGGPAAGTSDTNKSGELQAQQANVPLAPTLSNGTNTYYNKLGITINTSGSDASDYTYSIAVSTDGFTTTSYAQADGTLGATPVYQSYITWGGASGSYLIALSPATTYQVKVNAKQGTFDASAYGPSASATTANPSLTFSLTPNSLNLGSLLPGTIITGGTNISIGFATNGGSGGSIYIAGQNGGLKSSTDSYTITSASADLSTQSSGFGAQGLTSGQTSGGPLTISSPYNGSAGSVGAAGTSFRPIFATSASIAGGTATAALKAKAATTTPAATDYQEVLTFVASASF